MDGINSMTGGLKTKVNYHMYKFFGLQQSGNIENSERMEEFHEEDIWGSIDADTSEQVGFQDNGCNDVEVCRLLEKEGNYNNSRRSERNESYHEENNRRRMRHQSSAPINIPDRSQMVREEKRNENGRSRSHVKVDDDNRDDDEGGDLERNMMIPPHEVIARQLARSEITAFSVYEGIGRILRGRDAVWAITGFI